MSTNNNMILLLDLKSGIAKWELWSFLAWNEIKQKYRRSAVGPLWATVNFGFFTLTIGLLYSHLFNRELSEYLPHLAMGYLLWVFISQVALESCHLFSNMRSYILEIKVPLTAFVLMMLFKNIILLGFSMVVVVIIAFSYPLKLNLLSILGLMGVVVLLLNALWISLIIAIIASRFHDMIEIIGNLFRILFFLTPIIWIPGTEGRINYVLDLNPFYHLIEIVRGPMITGNFPVTSFVVSCGIALAGWIVTGLIYAKYRNRISYWV